MAKIYEVKTETMYFFFGRENPLSNWHQSTFYVKGVKFCCNEQFMMYCKAKLFEDHATAARILATSEPAEHKALGRQVKGFVEKIWESKRAHYVFVGALAKFQQNPDISRVLLDTWGLELVEAAKYDKIWGIGLSIDDPAIFNRTNWRGMNLLGTTLERVRDALKESE